MQLEQIDGRRNKPDPTANEVFYAVLDTLTITGYTQAMTEEISDQFIVLLFKNLSLERGIRKENAHAFLEFINKHYTETTIR